MTVNSTRASYSDAALSPAGNQVMREFWTGQKLAWWLNTLALLGVFMPLAWLAAWWAITLIQGGAVPIPGATPFEYAIAPIVASSVCIGAILLHLAGKLSIRLGCASFSLAFFLASISIFFWQIVLVFWIVVLLISSYWQWVLGMLALLVVLVAVPLLLERWLGRTSS
jgi:hypothetical protein